jgi:hypothetical protein
MTRDEQSGAHLHECADCGEAYECWCPYPEKAWQDQFSYCERCRQKKAVDSA